MKIRIETVGGYSSGLGHITRMRVLAKELIEKHKAEVEVVTDYKPFKQEDIVIVDVDTEYEALSRVYTIRENLPKAKIIVFRNGDINISMGTITFGGTRLDVNSIIEPTFDNVILDKCFRRGRHPYETLKDNIKFIFLNQGGSDPWGIAPRILHVLDLLRVRSTILVVVGSATHDLTVKQIKAFGNVHNDLPVVVYYDEPPIELKDLMSYSDVAITAPGQTFAELTAMSVPSIVIGHHEMHGRISRELGDKKAAIDLGVGVGMTDEELVYKLGSALGIMKSLKTRKNFVNNARKLININGIDKIIEYILEI